MVGGGGGGARVAVGGGGGGSIGLPVSLLMAIILAAAELDRWRRWRDWMCCKDGSWKRGCCC